MAKKSKKVYDQKYIDRYDRHTIETLKKIKEKYPYGDNPEHTVEFFQYFIERTEEGVGFSRNKDNILDKWVLEDEKNERLISQHPIPQSVNCNVCGSLMTFDSHFFDADNAPILFLFNCSEKTHKRKIVYTNGREYVLEKKRCKECGGVIIHNSNRIGNVLTDNMSCNNCNYNELVEIIISEVDQPINEKEREKYCTDYIGRVTFMEQMKTWADLYVSLTQAQEEKKIKEELKLDRIEKLNIPQLEKRLTERIEKLGFNKFQLEKPEIKDFVIIPFCLQDPTDRNDMQSIKLIKQTLDDALLFTNWRIIENKLSYRLGYITGNVKAYEREDDLIKIVKEIMQK